jgi:hypothetical protein
MSLGVLLMGLGVVVAGAAGLVLPEGRRVGALFALVIGGGVGLATLGIGAVTSEPREPSEFVFFLGSVLGFLAVCAGVWVARRRGPGAT